MSETTETFARRVDAIMAAMSSVIWFADAEMQVRGTAGWTEFSGQSEAAARGEGWLDVVHPDDRVQARTACMGAMTSCSPYRNRFRLRHRTEGWRWIENHVVPVKDGRDAVVEWVGVVADTHDHIERNEALRKSEELFRLAAKASRVGVWEVDLVTGTRRWSAELKAILGLPPETQESQQLFLSFIRTTGPLSSNATGQPSRIRPTVPRRPTVSCGPTPASNAGCFRAAKRS